jgi:16S rRNA (cytosine967-C5)-methyltransferase
VVKGLARHDAVPAAYAPDGVRIPAPQGHKRYPNMESETGHGRGWFEVQDEGSQIAARIAGAEPGMQVLDFCAGAGGKTLALAAAMGNKGQIHAYDRDRTRLRRIFPRLQRAGVRNCQIVEPGDEARLAALDGRMDLVFVDAPCSGSGTWRRRPDAKWRLSEAALDKRREEQAAVLEESAPKVKPGGRLVYVTCSVLPCENGERIEAFLAAHPEFKLLPAADLWAKQFAAPMPEVPGAPEGAILLTPHRSATDGFYIAVMERADG